MVPFARKCARVEAGAKRGFATTTVTKDLQKQNRKLFVPVHELFDVILHLNIRMDDRPKMSSSDKRKKR
jgi:hypothetical protein